MPMYFKNCFNPKKETLEIPRSSLHRANLLDAEELLLHTGGGYIIRQYHSERQAWSVDRLIQAEQAFFQAWGRLPTAREYTAENGLPMYSVFCALTREAFEARLEMLFQEVPAQIEEDQEPDESDSMSEMSFHF